MNLPILNSPIYTLELPSTGEDIEYRPFLVKEQKALMIAEQSKNQKNLNKTIIELINNCTFGKLDAESLPIFDVEIIFLKLRAKSVGETSDILLTCEECQTENEVKVDISQVKIDGQVSDNKIKLTDDVTIQMKPPTYLQVAENEKIVGEDATTMDRIFGLIVASISAVLTEEERIDFSEIKFDEAVEFLESMTSDQFTKIREYMENQPTLKHKVEYTCSGCGSNQNITLEGMQSFF